jgi:pimeloyl-ACP methyl ester carboxylesterase
LVEKTPSEELMRHLFTLIFSPAFIDERDEWLREMEVLLRPDDRTRNTMLRQLEMLEAEVVRETGAVPSPVLVLIGSQDRLVPPLHAEALARAYPRGRLKILEGVGHHPFLEATEEAAEAVLAFLEE